MKGQYPLSGKLFLWDEGCSPPKHSRLSIHLLLPRWKQLNSKKMNVLTISINISAVANRERRMGLRSLRADSTGFPRDEFS